MNEVEKWLWRFGRMEKRSEFLGYHRDPTKVHPVLMDGEWARGLTDSSTVNGKDMDYKKRRLDNFGVLEP